MTMKCFSCVRGFYKECGHKPPVENTESIASELTLEEPAYVPQRKHKRDDNLKDQQSTGRKRAARMYPLLDDHPCEWLEASPENPMGGGEHPVTVSCRELTIGQQARHHGPDKNTLNNDPGNVHRICHWHHNLWHRQNDPDYDPNKPLKD